MCSMHGSNETVSIDRWGGGMQGLDYRSGLPFHWTGQVSPQVRLLFWCILSWMWTSDAFDAFVLFMPVLVLLRTNVEWVLIQALWYGVMHYPIVAFVFWGFGVYQALELHDSGQNVNPDFLDKNWDHVSLHDFLIYIYIEMPIWV